MSQTLTNQKLISFCIEGDFISLNARFQKDFEVSIELLSMEGEVVFSRKLKKRDYLNDRIDISKIPFGLYYLKVTVDGAPSLKELIRHSQIQAF
jgi:hypothetical protein